ncbi:MAG: tape measure protein [Proteobacteria bacterium]|nr:tape measure protein [Pseudomonadota bacterium]MBU1648243.1 tape measure protein [Pseudomonadota bacterium]
MAGNNRVVIELYVDDKGTAKIKQFAGESEANFKKVEAAGTKSAASLSTGWQRLSAVLGPAMAAYFGVQAVKDVMMLADSYTLLDSRLALITDSASELTMVQDELFRISQETGTAYAANAATVSKLGIAMEAAGASSTELLAINELVNKSLIVSGASTAEQSSFLLQFGQAMGSGVLQGEEFRAMMEANSYFGSQLAKALDTDIAGLRKMSKEGKLTSDVLRGAFPKMATEINESFDKMPITIGRAMTMVQNSFGKVVSEANKSSDGTSEFASAIAGLSATIEQHKDILGGVFVGMAKGAEWAIRAAVGVVSTFQLVAAGSLALAGGILKVQQQWLKLTDMIHLTSGAAEAWQQNADAAFGSADELANKALHNFDKMAVSTKNATKELDTLTKSQGENKKAIDETTAAQIKLTDGQVKEAERILAAEKKKAEDIAAAQEEMFKETGAMADQHYAAEQQKLVEKAVRWKEANGNIVEIENWLYDQIGALEAEADAKGQITAAAAMDRAQGNYRTLIEQMAATVQTTTDQTDLIQNNIKGLDGTSFTITANLDGSGFESSIDTLIGRFRDLAAAASSAQAAAAGASPSGSSSGSGSSTRFSTPAYGDDDYQRAADAQTGRDGNSTTNININQQVSRSDVNSIISEQRRVEARK